LIGPDVRASICTVAIPEEFGCACLSEPETVAV
jgi:hypothetical protein